MRKILVILAVLLLVLPLCGCIGGSSEDQYFAFRTDYKDGYVTISNDSNFDWEGVTVSINGDYDYTFGSFAEGAEKEVNITLFEDEDGRSFNPQSSDPYKYKVKVNKPSYSEIARVTFGALDVGGTKNDYYEQITIINNNNYMWHDVTIYINEYRTYQHDGIIRAGESITLDYNDFSAYSFVPNTIKVKAYDAGGTSHTWEGGWD